MIVDARSSPFYAWLDHATLRDLVRRARALPPGERLVLLKALIPGLIEDLGDQPVQEFLDELRTKADRYAEAVAHPGRGGATRRTPGELLGGPVPWPEGHLHLGGARDPRRPGGRALERQWEAARWEEVQRLRTTEAD